MKNKWIIGIIVSIIIITGLSIYLKNDSSGGYDNNYRLISPEKGSLKVSISTTGMVMPQNRLEIKPTISGRIDKILVREGDYAATGKILAWMSSEERAALIDAARANGASAVEYWKKAYKPIPLIAPINGTVIVRSVEPGQSVLSSTTILVLSDRLIVEADVDETDIGHVKKGQNAIITLDAYPEVSVNGRVNHISYESTVSNNVTIYKVDILPEKIPDVFRSGMNASIEIIHTLKNNALLLPQKAVMSDEKGSYVLLKNSSDINSGKPARKYITTGISDDLRIEIRAGLSENDMVMIYNDRKLPVEKRQKTNPFRPFGRKRK